MHVLLMHLAAVTPYKHLFPRHTALARPLQVSPVTAAALTVFLLHTPPPAMPITH